MHEGGRPRRPALLVALLTLLVLLGSAAPAAAHAALAATDPRDGAVLKSAPRQLTLSFTESVGLLDGSVRLLGPDNRRVRVGEARHAPDGDDTVRVRLPDHLRTGTYTVAWRVVSADSHPVSGAFSFSIGKPSRTTAAADTGPPEHPATKALHLLARHLAYLAVALLLGTAAFTALCRPPDPAPLRRLLVTGWWTLLAATLALFLLRAPYETGAAPWTAFDPDGLTRTATTRPGIALLARVALLLLAVRLPGRRTPAVRALLAVGLALTWAAAEHASAGIQVPVAMVSSVLHLLAMSAWLGGLAALLTCLRRGGLPTATVHRYSCLALASVTVLVVTGVYQSWRGLGSLDALTQTTYGRLLAAKTAAVVLLLGAAWVSRGLVREPASGEATPGEATSSAPAPGEATAVPERALERVGGPSAGEAEGGGGGEPAPAHPDGGPAEHSPSPSSPPPPLPSPPYPDRRRLRRSVLAELAVAVVVLALTTLLTGTLPGRAAAEAAAAGPATVLPPTTTTTVPFDVGTPGGRGTVQITLDPARTGENSVQAVAFAPDGGLVSVPEIRLAFTHPGQDIGPIDAGLADRGGYWATDTLDLPVPGSWRMKATVRVSEFDQVTVARTVRIG
ncbi:copper resistance protein CopC [Streptomyces sp. JB150]|uniref:copper resistance CopC/CopD family protein n=1 Tax=Streptomyces sp. JB150 TaxID=2714844 RepID=UPI001F0D1DAA|nr:copper resistance protein CopC [Streptomyces sp. JB150]